MKYLFPICLMILSCSPAGQKIKSDTVHEVSVVHPSFESNKPKVMKLTRVKDGRGYPVEYHMMVDSVVCPDKVCEVVQVRMHWDALGNFLRIEFPGGVQLTKQGHKKFTAADYDKLKEILRDGTSLLKDYPMKSLAGPSVWLKADVRSGATRLSVRKAVVAGAGYTCYNLWHWANGPVIPAIRELTHQSCDRTMLREYLDDERKDRVLFALDHLKVHRIFDKETIRAVKKQIFSGYPANMELAVQYLRQALSEKDYCRTMAEIFGKVTGKSQEHLLGMFTKEEKLPADFLDDLSDALPKMAAYYEIHLLLKLVEKHDHVSGRILNNAAKLLKHANFFIGRRAYEFLMKQKLDEGLKKQTAAFHKENEDRL